jgi:hypothetical protein
MGRNDNNSRVPIPAQAVAALIRRFARNYDIHFGLFSKRHRPRSSALEAWAAKFLERLDKAKAVAAARSENNSN